jgi:hypothetical protein
VDAIVILRGLALLGSGIGAVRELRWSKGEAEDGRRGIPAPPRDCEDVTALRYDLFAHVNKLLALNTTKEFSKYDYACQIFKYCNGASWASRRREQCEVIKTWSISRYRSCKATR